MDRKTLSSRSKEPTLSQVISKFDYIRFTIVDFHGVTRSKTVPKDQLYLFYEDGCSFFAGAIGFGLVGTMVPRHVPSIRDTNSGNVFSKPQWSTLHHLPLNGAGRWKVGEVFCETEFPLNGTIQSCNPRTMARAQLERLATLGYSLKSSWELEVCFLDQETGKPNFNRSIHVFTNDKFNEMETLMYEADEVFKKLGIRIETLQTEASSGQYEFAMHPVAGISQSDNLIMMKDALRQLAKNHKKKAVFMSQPFDSSLGQTMGSALHLNHSLTNDANQLLFSDLDGTDKLSDIGRHWLAGLLKHAPALTAIFSPTVNCYRRLHHGASPGNATWGIDARSTCYRVKNYTPGSTYIECRAPSGSANPYLVTAATVAAGIDGLLNKYPCPSSEPRESPEDAVKLPRTLGEALEALKADVCLCEALGEEFIDWFLTIKGYEINHFEGFDPDVEDADMMAKERACYMDLV